MGREEKIVGLFRVSFCFACDFCSVRYQFMLWVSVRFIVSVYATQLSHVLTMSGRGKTRGKQSRPSFWARNEREELARSLPSLLPSSHPSRPFPTTFPLFFYLFSTFTSLQPFRTLAEQRPDDREWWNLPPTKDLLPRMASTTPSASTKQLFNRSIKLPQQLPSQLRYHLQASSNPSKLYQEIVQQLLHHPKLDLLLLPLLLAQITTPTTGSSRTPKGKEVSLKRNSENWTTSLQQLNNVLPNLLP